MTEQPAARLQHLPVSWFAMIMGLGGLTIAWNRAEAVLQLPLRVSPALLGLTTLLFALLAGLYSAKVILHPRTAAMEWAHPVKINFVPAISIALILLAIAWLPFNAPWSRLLWTAGTLLHLFLTLYVITQWVHHDKFQIVHMNPAWFIPVVGNILVPIVGVQHGSLETSWFFFSIGLLFWPLLLTIVLYRVIFHGSLPERLMPTLFILIAPPAVGFLSYLQLTNELDAFARVLYHTALFFTLLLLFQARWFLRLNFYLSWWAYSFPLAAISIATLAMFHHTQEPLYLRLAGVLLGVASVIIAALLARTAIAVVKREICVEE